MKRNFGKLKKKIDIVDEMMMMMMWLMVMMLVKIFPFQQSFHNFDVSFMCSNLETCMRDPPWLPLVLIIELHHLFVAVVEDGAVNLAPLQVLQIGWKGRRLRQGFS